MQLPTGENLPILQAFAASVAAFLVIVSFHLVGLHGVAHLVISRGAAANLSKRPFLHTVVFIVTVMFVLFALHMFTNFAWALFMWGSGVLPNFRDCTFYSLENYTALGLTRVNVSDTWRGLAPMISLSGVFCLAWSTAVLIRVFSEFYGETSDV